MFIERDIVRIRVLIYIFTPLYVPYAEDHSAGQCHKGIINREVLI